MSHLRVAAWDNRVAGNFDFQMTFVDWKTYPELAAQYGVTEAPALVAVDFRSGKHTIAPADFKPEVRVELTRFMLNIWNNRTVDVKYVTRDEQQEQEVIVIQFNPDALKTMQLWVQH